MVGFKLARLAPVALIFMLCLSALAAGACAVAEDAGGGAPSAEPPPAKTPLTLDEGDLPFDALTLWSAQRFLDERGIFAIVIRGALQNDFGEFIPDASLGEDNDILMLELLFDNAGASELEFELNGDNGQFALILNSATALAETSAVYPTAWVEVTSDVTEPGNVGFIDPNDNNPPTVDYKTADESLTLAPNAMERVWLTFEIAPALAERPVALRYRPASGDPVEFALID